MFFSYVLVLYYVYIMVLQYYFICAYICVDMYLFLFELSNYTFILVKYLLIYYGQPWMFYGKHLQTWLWLRSINLSVMVGPCMAHCPTVFDSFDCYEIFILTMLYIISSVILWYIVISILYMVICVYPLAYVISLLADITELVSQSWVIFQSG